MNQTSPETWNEWLEFEGTKDFLGTLVVRKQDILEGFARVGSWDESMEMRGRLKQVDEMIGMLTERREIGNEGG